MLVGCRGWDVERCGDVGALLGCWGRVGVWGCQCWGIGVSRCYWGVVEVLGCWQDGVIWGHMGLLGCHMGTYGVIMG